MGMLLETACCTSSTQESLMVAAAGSPSKIGLSRICQTGVSPILHRIAAAQGSLGRTWHRRPSLQRHGDIVRKVQNAGPTVASVGEQEGGSVSALPFSLLLALASSWHAGYFCTLQRQPCGGTIYCYLCCHTQETAPKSLKHRMLVQDCAHHCGCHTGNVCTLQ